MSYDEPEMSSSTSKKSYDKYRAECDLRAITEARRIEKDADRMADVKRAAKDKLSEMADLKKLAGE